MFGLLLWWVLVPEARPPPPGTCVVAIDGMPVSVMRHHQVSIGTAHSRRATETFVFTLGEDERTRVELTGPRYYGRRWISRSECDAQSPLSLSVRPQPAKLTMACPHEGMTLVCEDCPEPIGGKVYFADQFPSIDVESFETTVWILFRAPGRRRKLQQLTLHPGPNVKRVVLDPL